MISHGVRRSSWCKACDLYQILRTIGRLFAGVVLLVFAHAMCMVSVAEADVDTVGGLEKTSSGLGSLHSEIGPLATSANGDYKCSSAYADSDVQNGPFGFAIGNCAAGSTVEVVSYSGENSQGYHAYGGFVNGAFQGCGWIETRFPLEKQNSNKNSKCGEGSTGSFLVAEAEFMNGKPNSGESDGSYVVNQQACPEYANYRPWSEKNVEQELVRTVPAYAAQEPGSSAPALKWRYVTKYESTDGTGRYVMVRDDRYQPGEANWVFVPRSCLPSTLPTNENERLPNPPSVATTAASSVTTTQAVLNGTVNPNGIEATYYFEYGPSTSYGSSTYPGDAEQGKSQSLRVTQLPDYDLVPPIIIVLLRTAIQE